MSASDPLAVLRALGQHAIQHCPHRLGISEAWRRDPAAEWRVVHTSCESCHELAEALGLPDGARSPASA